MVSNSREASFRDFFRTATGGFTPYGWQLQVAVDGLPDVLPVPTALGKTEVALVWAWRLLVDKQPEPLHLVVSLPMRSLVTQTVQRLKTYFDALKATKPEIDVGVHQLMGGVIEDEWVRQPDKPWILVGTQDQLLSRALNRGYAMSRLSGRSTSASSTTTAGGSSTGRRLAAIRSFARSDQGRKYGVCGVPTIGLRAEPSALVIGYDQWPFRFSIATLPEHVRALQEHQLT